MWNYKEVDILGTNYFIREKNDSMSHKNLLLLHGLGWTGEVWSSTAKYITNYRIIAPDLAGHGNSDSAKSYDFNLLSKHLKELLNKLKIHEVNIIASSWGATLGINFANENPELVDSLILLDGGFYPFSETPDLEWDMLTKNPFPEENLQDISSFLELMRSDNPDFWNDDIEKAVHDQVLIEENGKVKFKSNEEVQLACLRELWNYNPLQAMDNITASITVVIATSKDDSQDEIVFKLRHGDILRRLKKANIIHLRNTDHLIMLDSPKKIAELIQAQKC